MNRSHPQFIALFCVALLMATIAGASTANAQAFWRVEETKTNADNYYYYYVNPGTATVRVHMLGAVRQPGLYEISEDTDLGQLVALSGGPPMTVHPKGSRLDVSVRVYRRSGDGESVIFEHSLDRTLANPGGYPTLVDGDVIVMDVTQLQRIGWRDTTRIISAAGIIALAVERLVRVID